MVSCDRAPVVEVGILDDAALQQLAATAVPDAAVSDVMPGTLAPSGWTHDGLRAFIEFHRGRRGGLDGPARELTFAVWVDSVASGVVRLQRVSPDALEVGMWLARGARRRGVGGRVLVAAAERALALGARTLVAETTASNRAALAALQRIGAHISDPSETGAVHAELDLVTQFTG